VAPPRLVAAAAWARSHYCRHRRCAACDELERELDDGRRVVEVTRHFLVVVPFAAGSTFEQWILPRRHQASFDQTDDRELIDFAALLHRTLQRLKIAVDDPPYNFFLESGPTAPADALSMHWGLRIAPDLVTPGGFELGAGLLVNPSRPEDDAEALRAATPPAKEDAT
jgi:UDPglucose--hexose-1-phosphate uridylyltransferase